MKLPRAIVLLLIVYLAIAGYVLVVWLPTIIGGYQTIANSYPWLAYGYLGFVVVMAVALLGVSVTVFYRLWRNTRNKEIGRERRQHNPSELSNAQLQAELRENLSTSQSYAADAAVSAELRGEIEKALKSLDKKHADSRLEIVAFGTISSGKSSLLNSLAGRQVFASDVLGGTTSVRSEVPWPTSEQVILVDTPGLAEVRGEERASIAALAAKNADLVLMVVDGPLKSYEVDLVKKLLDMEKRIVVCLNKEDWYDEEEEAQLASQISQQLPGIAEEDVVAVRAAAVNRERIRVTSSGDELTEEYEVPPNVAPLAERLLQIVQKDGRELLLANLLLQSRGLVDEAKDRVRAVLDKKANEIITRHMWAAGGAAGINPIPLLDLAGGSAITIKMVLELANVYKQPIDADGVMKMLEQLGKNLIAMVGATAVSPAVAAGIGSLLKTVPGIGTIAGGLVQGITQALVTRWIGNVFVEYYRRDMQAPPGGLAELARDQWQQLTRADSLRKLVQRGRTEIAKTFSDADSSDDRKRS
jgi:small GTP-binding protein